VDQRNQIHVRTREDRTGSKVNKIDSGQSHRIPNIHRQYARRTDGKFSLSSNFKTMFRVEWTEMFVEWLPFRHKLIPTIPGITVSGMRLREIDKISPISKSE
jgi:hypothetical protein